MVVGFVGWLWSIGLFDNPMTMAALLGGATLFVLAVGIALVRFSRYQQAGTGLTLLASMALPLNLWFYDAQGLVTLADGGHLWIPAAVCCAIYALIARVLRNEVFVYTLVGGIVLTGMLFLADQSIGRFWELLPPATFLIAAGWICIHVERLFAAGDSDFSRDKFGRAFFRCGLVVLAGGFGLLLSGQLMSFFGDFLGYPTLPEIASNRSLKIWALGLVVASTIGSAVESMLGKKRGWVIATLGLTAWSVICLLDVLVLQFQLTIAHLAIVVAIVISFENVLSKGTERAKKFGPLEGLLCLLAICQFASTHLFGQFFGQPLTNSWIGVAQLFTTAVACATGWFRWRRKYGVDTPASGSSLLSMAGVLTVLAAVSAAMALHVGRSAQLR